MGTNTTYTAGTGNKYITLYLYVEESGTDVASNTSEIIWEVGVRKSSSSTASTWGNWSWSVSVNGAEWSGSLSGTVAPGGSLKFSSGSTTAAHNSDGTKTITCDASVGGKESGSLGARTFSLTTIPRVSVPTLSASSAAFGETITVMTNRSSSAFTHHLYYSMNGAAEVGIAPGITDSFTWTIPKSLMTGIPDALSAQITLRLYTFSGDTNLGSNTVSFTATVPADVRPGITDSGWAVIAYDNSASAASGISAAVQGYSRAKVTFTAAKVSFAYGAGLKSFSLSYAGKSLSLTDSGTLTTDILTAAGTASLTCTVTDTRGRTQSAVRTLTVLPYGKPTLTGVTIARADSSGNESASGNYLLLKATASVSSISPNGTELNPIAVFRGEYKETTASDYTVGPSLASGERTVYAAALDVTKSYRARIVLKDTLGSTAVSEVIIPTDSVAFFLKDGGTAAAFGKYAENDSSLESAWTVRAPDFERDGIPIFASRTLSGTTMNDTSIAPGVYWCNTAAVAGGPTTTGVGWLTVWPNRQVQEFMSYSTHIVYRRGYASGAWSGWTRMTGGELLSTVEQSRSVSPGVTTALCSLTLTAGTWIIIGGVRFEETFESGRHLALNITPTSGYAGFQSYNAVRNTYSTAIVVERFPVLEKITKTTTYYLNCYHSCSTARTVNHHLSAVRIA